MNTATSTVRTSNGLDLTYHRLDPGQHLDLHARPIQETAIILLAGDLTAKLPDQVEEALTRANPFTAPAVGWHLPPAVPASVAAGPHGADLVQVHAPAAPTRTTATTITAPDPEVRGHGSWQRRVTTLLQPPRTARLLLGETIALDGGWSTYPPHRHEHSDPPRETELQEAFAFRVNPPTGFGVLLTYDDTVDNAHATVLTDTTLATVTHGYHTVAAAAGYDLYYLWAAHGSRDTHFALHTDPAHAWLLD